jgi:hypothetical protein
LTFFLQDSLGGDSKALMFVQGAASSLFRIASNSFYFRSLSLR